MMKYHISPLSFRLPRLLLGLLAAVLLTGCHDHFNIDDLQYSPRLVVYAMPTAGDTTLIRVTSSLPVSSKRAMPAITDATVRYALNGQSCEVTNMGEGNYRVIAPQKAGDEVRIDVVADGFTAVSAATTVPQAVPIGQIACQPIRIYDTYEAETRNELQLRATFTDPADSHDYYAVRVVNRNREVVNRWHGADWGFYQEEEFDRYDYPNVHFDSEPLLQKLSNIDYDFGFDDTPYQHMVLFDDRLINGQTYTLKLNLPTYADAMTYAVELYHLTPKYYHFLKSVSEAANSDLARAGLAVISPTYSNVKGGIGYVGGYLRQVTSWINNEKK